jgi:hypothetical protein
MPDLRSQSSEEQRSKPAARINARWRSKFLQNFGFLLTAIVRDRFFDVKKLDCDSSELMNGSALAARDRSVCSQDAPPCGLYPARVNYDWPAIDWPTLAGRGDDGVLQSRSIDPVPARSGTDWDYSSRQYRAHRPSIAAMSRTCSSESHSGQDCNKRTMDSFVARQRVFRCRPLRRKRPECVAKVSRPSPDDQLLQRSIARAASIYSRTAATRVRTVYIS